MNFGYFLAFAFLAGSIERSNGDCCFQFPSNGKNCNVRIPDDQLCQLNPCLSNEYCKVVRGRTSCCTQEFRSLATAFGSDQSFCQERCLSPPRNPPSPRSPACPSTSGCVPGNPPPPQPQAEPKQDPKPEPQPAPQPEPKNTLNPPKPTPSKEPTARPQPPNPSQNGKCCFPYKTQNRDCQVCLAPEEQCQSNPCGGDEYCRLRRGRMLCCTQEFRSLATAFGQDSSFCQENCLLPSSAPSTRYPVCPLVVPRQLPQQLPPPQRECPTLTNPANGAVSVKDGKATYRCNSGFLLKPDEVRQCDNGVWNGNTPQCVKNCYFSGSCKVCLKKTQVCDNSRCSSGRYCQVYRGKQYCCRLGIRNGRCAQLCSSYYG